MLVQPILSLFTRMIPEAFLIMYAIYLLSNTQIHMKRLIVSSIIGGSAVYLIRLLPIHFGVHTILAIMLYIFLAFKINKIEIYKSIAFILVSQIILFVSDFIFVVVYTKVMQLPSELIFGQTLESALAGIPPLLLFFLVVRFITFIKAKKESHE